MGYLKADVKDLIDAIVDEIGKDERLAFLYELWYQKREEVIQTYTKERHKRIRRNAHNIAAHCERSKAL